MSFRAIGDIYDFLCDDTTSTAWMDEFQLDIETPSYRRTPIYRAICAACPEQLLLCLQMGQNSLERDDEFGTTYLHTVLDNVHSSTENQYIQMIYLLSNAGVDVNARDYKGKMALHQALEKMLPDVVVALIRCGADCSPVSDRGIIDESHSPFELEVLHWYQKFEPGLWGAVERNDLDLAERLVNSWCRIRVSRDGKSLIRYARENNRKLSIVELLEQNRASLEFIHATLAGDELRMEELLNNKNIDVYMKDVSYQTNCLTIGYPRSLRDAAASMGHKHVLRLLPIDHSTPDKYWGFIRKYVLTPAGNGEQDNDPDQYKTDRSDKTNDSESITSISSTDNYQNVSKISRVITANDCMKNNLKKPEMEPSSICTIM
ncbi:uncharacterized protein LOC141914880 [Tubulanus polymorphus]|uniref:uncharacterized protein LOC141914880 n=1 Tax=Tubulanus polymorphus TaxID=672921 RepID=UPI003DA2533C